MSSLIETNDPAAVHPRRMFLAKSGLLLSGAAVALMAGQILSKTIAKLGGKAVAAKATRPFPTATLKTQADVMRFAASLEKGAVPLFGNRALAKAAASILGDEAMHRATLRNALGEAPVPSAFMS